MPLQTPQQGHVDQLLTDFSVAYMQDASGFVAGELGTVKPVARQSDKFLVYPRGFWFRSEAASRPLGGVPKNRSLRTTTDTYACSTKWIETSVDDEERANATPPYDPEREAAELIATDLMLRRELDFASAALTSSAWTTAITGVASSPSTGQTLQWDQSAAQPGTVVRAQQNAVKLLTGMKPNVLAVGADLAVSLTETADFVDKVKYTGTGGVIADATEMARYFNVEKVVIADAVKNTADENATGSMTGGFVMGSKDALLLYRSPQLGLKTATAVTVFAWTGLLGAAAYSPAVVFRGRDDRAHSDWFQGAMAYDVKITAPDLGVYFSSMAA